MRWGTVTIAYREKNFIVPHLRSLKDAGYEKSIVVVSEKPFFGKAWPEDGTPELADNEGALVINGVFPRDEQMLNLANRFLKDCDYVLFLAPDEFLTKEDHEKLRKFVEENKEYDSFSCTNMSTYFKTPFYRVEPKETQIEGRKYIYRPIIVVKPTTKWIDIRNVVGSVCPLPEEIHMHHFAYMRTDEEVKRKMEVNSNADVVAPDWYTEVWEKWTPETKNFHPEFPEQFESVVYQMPPRDILHHLAVHPCVRGMKE